MATDYSIPARMRRFKALHRHRAAESSSSFIREKCARTDCREGMRPEFLAPLFPGGPRLCPACRAELVDSSPEEQARWGMTTPRPTDLRRYF